MHDPSMSKMLELMRQYALPLPRGKQLMLDVGSRANGDISYKRLGTRNRIAYRGVDIQPGENVDFVVPEREPWDVQQIGTYPLVISGQTFEHVRWPWLLMEQINSVLDPGGILIVIAPFLWQEHRHPWDCYRYLPQGLEALFEWVSLDVLESGKQRPDTWCVGRKPK